MGITAVAPIFCLGKLKPKGEPGLTRRPALPRITSPHRVSSPRLMPALSSQVCTPLTLSWQEGWDVNGLQVTQIGVFYSP